MIVFLNSQAVTLDQIPVLNVQGFLGQGILPESAANVKVALEALVYFPGPDCRVTTGLSHVTGDVPLLYAGLEALAKVPLKLPMTTSEYGCGVKSRKADTEIATVAATGKANATCRRVQDRQQARRARRPYILQK